jgi:hypothetical protein
MFKLADLFVQITGDSRPLNASLALLHQQLLGMTGIGGSIGNSIASGILGPMLGVNSATALLATSMGVGLVAAATVATSKCVMLFSALKETTNKAEQAFGSYTKTVLDAADEMADRYGIVKQSFIDASANFGFKFTGAGVAAKEAADMSVNLTKLAAEVTSLQNITMDEALTRMFSALNGEMISVSRWGVDLSEDNVKLKAMAMGLRTGTHELDQQTKVMVRYRLLMDGLKPAVGDLARTELELANQMRRFQGNVENCATAWGEHFEPAARGALRVVNYGLENANKQAERLRSNVINAAGVMGVLYRVNMGFLEWLGGKGETPEDVAKRRAALDKGIADSTAMSEGGGGGKKAGGWSGGIVEFAKKVQDSAFGAKDYGKKTVDELKKMGADVKKMAAAAEGAMPGMPKPESFPWF